MKTPIPGGLILLVLRTIYSYSEYRTPVAGRNSRTFEPEARCALRLRR